MTTSALTEMIERDVKQPTKEFGIWITNDAEIKMGWTDTKQGPAVRSEIYFKTVKEASDWAATYKGF